MNDTSLQITSHSTENHFSNVAYLAYDNVLYCFNIVGESDAQIQVESTLERVMDSFPKESETNEANVTMAEKVNSPGLPAKAGCPGVG